MNDYLLQIKNLNVEFHTFDGVVRAINNLNLDLPRGKTVGLVGETGAGKTTTSLAIMGLIPKPVGVITSGEILYNSKDLLRASQKEMQALRGNKISMIFQNPMTSLNPVYQVGRQISEVIVQHQNCSKTEAQMRAGDILEVVGIPRSRMTNYPHEFSGGMKQRVCIAMGLSCNPDLLIADEPTTALDVTIQAQILDLMRDLKTKFNTSIVFITHALGVVADIADYVMVMYAGSIIERGTIKEIYTDPRHPYTQGLFGCLPSIDEGCDRLNVIPGSMPDPMRLPVGCRFYPRCENSMEICLNDNSAEYSVGGEHFVRCHLYREEATP